MKSCKRWLGWSRAGRVVAAVCALGVCLGTSIGAAQRSQPNGASAAPAFEVVSVKRNTSATPTFPTWRVLPSGQFTANGAPLRELIRVAYGMRTLPTQGQVLGGPNWLGDRFDIIAKPPASVVAEADGSPSATTLAMLRTMLEDRFKVKVHTESRPTPIYALVVAKPGTLGSHLKPSTADCQAGGCTVTRAGLGQINARGVTIPQLVQFLTAMPIVGRVVRDETGLSGRFDLQIEFTPALPPQPGAAPANDPGNTIFTALTEQLGLKLDPRTGPVDVVVVDGAEPPSEN